MMIILLKNNINFQIYKFYVINKKQINKILIIKMNNK